MYSFLKKPLDYYIADSNSVFLLDLYKVTINERDVKIFYKNIEVLQGFADVNFAAKITLNCFNSFGLEIKDPLEIGLKNEYDLKVFNLFFKKNVPFSYNKKSNNGWLEVYLDDKYERIEVEKICKYSNFIKSNVESKNKFYDELNQPQMDLETRFKNYKAVKLTLETNYSSSLSLKLDDNYEWKCKESNEKTVKIVVEPLVVNGERVNLPIATFVNV